MPYYRTLAYTLNGSGRLTGLWQPEGRALDPELAESAFDMAACGNNLALFDGIDRNGPRTLFVADLFPLGESTLVSWGLNIKTVL